MKLCMMVLDEHLCKLGRVGNDIHSLYSLESRPQTNDHTTQPFAFGAKAIFFGFTVSALWFIFLK